MITLNNNIKSFIVNHLETHDTYIINEREDYNLASFKNCQLIYNKLTSMNLLFDWFPKLWSFVIYKNKDIRKEFLNNMYDQVGYDYQLNSFNNSKSYVYLNNRVEISYNNGTKDYIILES